MLSAALCLALAIVCVLLGYHHAQLALAVMASERSEGKPTPAAIEWIETRIEAAAPNLIPPSRYLRARWLARGSGLAGGEAAALHASLEDLRWVAARRPTWPPVWAAIVAVKARLHQNDPEFHQALARSFASGPNETRSFTELFPWLRLRWHWLNDREREALTQFTVRAAWREPKWVVEQAASYYFLDPLCRRSGGNRLALLHCERLGWAPEGTRT